MNIPVQIGWQQFVLLLIAALGVGMLISTLVGLWQKEKVLEEYEDETGHTFRRWRHRRRLRWKRGFSGIVMVIVAISLLWVTFAVQTYLGLTGDIKVATVRALPVANQSHEMSVDLTLYDQHGNQQSEQIYDVAGDRWMLQANVIEFPTWLNIVGLHAGYKVTRLFGQYNDINQRDSVPVALNGGDGDFFDAAQQSQWWAAPFVKATYVSDVGRPADGQSYNVYMNQTGLHL